MHLRIKVDSFFFGFLYGTLEIQEVLPKNVDRPGLEHVLSESERFTLISHML